MDNEDNKIVLDGGTVALVALVEMVAAGGNGGNGGMVEMVATVALVEIPDKQCIEKKFCFSHFVKVYVSHQGFTKNFFPLKGCRKYLRPVLFAVLISVS